MLDVFKFLRKIFPPKRKIFKHELVCVTAKTGSGKSVLQSHLANVYHADMKRRKMAEQEIINLNKGGFNKLRLPETLVYSDTGILLRGEKDLVSNVLNPYELQTPNEVEDNALLPPYSVLFVDEPYKYWGNRESGKFPERVESWFFTHRHMKISMYMFYQDKNGVDKKIRENLHKYWSIEDMKIKYHLTKSDVEGYRQIKRVEWTIYEYYDYESYLQGVIPLSFWDKLSLYWTMYNPLMLFPLNIFDYAQKKRLKQDCQTKLDNNRCVKLVKIIHDGNPFELYDSYFFAPVQYQNRRLKEDITYEDWASNLMYKINKHRFYTPNIKDYKQFGLDIIYDRPETFTKITRAKSIKNKLDKQQSKCKGTK